MYSWLYAHKPNTMTHKELIEQFRITDTLTDFQLDKIVSIHNKIFLNKWYNAKLFSTLVGAKEALRLAEDDLVAAREYVAQLEKEKEESEDIFIWLYLQPIPVCLAGDKLEFYPRSRGEIEPALTLPFSLGFFIDSPQWHKESMSKRRYVGCDSGGNDFSVSTPDQDHPTKQPHPFWDKEVKRYRAQFR